MKLRRIRDKALVAVSILLIGISLIICGACEPEVPLEIENKTDKVLEIYIEEVHIGEVQPDNSITEELAAIFGYLLIEAKNSEGETVFSKRFGIDELYDADWKVAITQLDEVPVSSENTTTQ